MNDYLAVTNKGDATFESRHKAAILWLMIVFVGLVAYAIEGGMG